MKLNQAEAKIKSYDDKWKYQNQAIQTAKQELHKLEKEQEGYNGWSSERAGLMHALQEEKQKAKDLQDRINELSRQHSSQNGFLDAIQVSCNAKICQLPHINRLFYRSRVCNTYLQC